ncbi:MAG: TIGR03905 family TSCPD domain-containing protein [Acutalibacteraceae bacterium]|nr:TIGR03905 family TSCPD domain-containing protein [Acutalibacteraceae bacterium]
MTFTYKTRGTCSSQITFDLDGNVVSNVKFYGGCNGNLKGIANLVEGMTVEEISKKLSGVTCGFKSTSCPDQLARAIVEAYQSSK